MYAFQQAFYWNASGYHTLVIFTSLYLTFIIEPVREKTNNLRSNQVRHKPGGTVTEDG